MLSNKVNSIKNVCNFTSGYVICFVDGSKFEIENVDRT
jgi:hypothetical protein